jgi:hypothetical protein
VILRYAAPSLTDSIVVTNSKYLLDIFFNSS